ncbi:hypothetical protein [Arenimonas caeni]|jgi:hypothetical protein|uniref:Uncharacterized protein n=1 Tax=Arenimonas caeni TaxID=2058085 RepID=A0A2P6M658_9GAMM|nr:hypothetical protein [Arenimonas caeni]MDY0021643.1 hypothetical protein [Arenimonas caeni]PRH81484.1 hypothetical protein C6N40_12415 [Arenimonas caeni]
MSANANPRWLLPTVLVAGLAIIAGGWWMAEQRSRRAADAGRVDEVLAEFQKGLPREYAPGLVLERVAFEGNELVMTIRSLTRTVPETGGDLQQVAAAEKALMLPLCQHGDVLFLLARGVVLKRRFVDHQDRIFFEITLTSADCAR